LAKLEALANDPGAAVGERRSARMRVAELLSEHPAIDAERLAETVAEPAGTAADDLAASRRAQVNDDRARGFVFVDAEALQDDLREAIEQHAQALGLDVEMLGRWMPWLRD